MHRTVPNGFMPRSVTVLIVSLFTISCLSTQFNPTALPSANTPVTEVVQTEDPITGLPPTEELATEVPTEEPHLDVLPLEVKVSVDVQKCTCKGEVRSVHLVIIPVNGVAPYRLHTTYFDMVSSTVFAKTQEFNYFPGSTIDLTVTSTDERVYSESVSIPSSCTPALLCLFDDGADDNANDSTNNNTNDNTNNNTNDNTDDNADDNDDGDDGVIVDVCVEPNENSNKCKNK